MDAEAFHPRQFGTCLLIVMTAGTGLSGRIDLPLQFVRIGGVINNSFFIDDADSNDARLASDRINELMQPLTVIMKHGILRAALERVRQSLRRRQGAVLEM